eukprot:TRINITY_DN1465_c0_g2_i2.p1 TRINITY_DN1465_c0_g2~~TRINITY_DN1465_c0_g2_i2.p1  ORF type:complete len:674 (-),score=214.27 TRINITY_DN1465_c0_g2_i2:468-2489(-)
MERVGSNASLKRPNARKDARLNIKDIIMRNGEDSIALKDGMKQQLFQNVEQIRRKCDKQVATLDNLKDENHELQQKLLDLKKEGNALGLEGHAVGNRLAAVSTISKRPVFAHRTRLFEMEERHAQLLDTFESLKLRQKMLIHMRRRLQNDLAHVRARGSRLKEVVHKQQIKMADVKRDHIQASEKLNNANARLAKVQEQVSTEIQLWEMELSDKKGFLAERKKMGDQYKKKMEEQRASKESLKKHGKSQYSGNVATIVAARILEHTMQKQLEVMLDEEQKYKKAFKEIGITSEKLDAPAIIRQCLAQTEINDELTMKRTERITEIDSLKTRLSSTQEKLNDSFYGAERTTNRVLGDHEKLLNEEEKSLEKSRSRFLFMKNVVQPVKIGVQHLAESVTTDKFGELRSEEDVMLALHRIQESMGRIRIEVESKQEIEEIEKAKEKEVSLASTLPGTLDTSSTGSSLKISTREPLSAAPVSRFSPSFKPGVKKPKTPQSDNIITTFAPEPEKLVSILDTGSVDPENIRVSAKKRPVTVDRRLGVAVEDVDKDVDDSDWSESEPLASKLLEEAHANVERARVLGVSVSQAEFLHHDGVEVDNGDSVNEVMDRQSIKRRAMVETRKAERRQRRRDSIEANMLASQIAELNAAMNNQNNSSGNSNANASGNTNSNHGMF